MDWSSIPRGRPPPALTLSDADFVEVESGRAVALKGYSWFGFNNGQTSVDGLWAGGSVYHTDFAAIVYKLQLLGFNTVRLPFVFGDLPLPAVGRAMPCTPATTEEWKRHVTPPGVAVPGKELWQPPVQLPDTSCGLSSAYLPATTTLDRLLWTVCHLVAAGHYVLLDYHPMGEEHTADDVQQFVASWAALWRRLTLLPHYQTDLRGRVMVDIMNEPDSNGHGWEACGAKPGAGQLYLGVMDALHALDPCTIFFINGTGQEGFGVNHGNGFVTDGALIQQYGLSDPRPFFDALLGKPYRSHVVISPHVYGPSVSHAQQHAQGPGLWHRLTCAAGYLSKHGYSSGGDCQRFPIAIGEFGSRFQHPGDLKHLRDFALWLNNSGAAADGHHRRVGSWIYWCYNANSTDTGGLVDDHWRGLQWAKLRFLEASLGLRPWYSTPNEDMHVYRGGEEEEEGVTAGGQGRGSAGGVLCRFCCSG